METKANVHTLAGSQACTRLYRGEFLYIPSYSFKKALLTDIKIFKKAEMMQNFLHF
jgi:hypothetical protein